MGYCCPLGKRHQYSASSGHSCVPITYNNCSKVVCTYGTITDPSTITCSCSTCSTGFSLNGTN